MLPLTDATQTVVSHAVKFSLPRSTSIIQAQFLSMVVRHDINGLSKATAKNDKLPK